MYAIYLRKSRADRDLPKLSESEILTRHEKILTELAEKENYEISKIYREVASGETIAARPVMQKLLADVEQGLYKGVLVVEIERLARGNSIDQGIVSQTFTYSNTLIITPSKIYNPANEFDEEFFEFGLFMSRREYKTINRRLQAGRTSSHREGKYVGSMPPYGYDRVKLINQKGWTLKPNENSDIVKLIFHLYTQNNPIGCRKICDYLNNMGIKSAKGGLWTVSVVSNILKNEIYIGKIAHNKSKTKKQMINGNIEISRLRQKDYELFEGIHPAIIDTETWSKAQCNIKKSPPVSSAKEIVNPLAGLLICGKCGGKLQRRPHSKNQSKDYLICKKGCNNVGSPLKEVEDAVIYAIKVQLDSLKLPDCTDENRTPQGNILTLNIIEKELSSLLHRVDILFDLVERRIYDSDTFTARYNKLKSAIAILEQQKHNLTEALSLQSEEFIPDKNSFSAKRSLSEYYKLLSPCEKNKLLKELFKKIIYIKNHNSRQSNTDESSFTLELICKI
mgnify:CR=1 FL=1